MVGRLNFLVFEVLLEKPKTTAEGSRTTRTIGQLENTS
jgi:hypothetical protein